MSSPTYNMHLIMNTHWDREFRWSFNETQMRLMEAGDILVEAMERDPRFKYFHPDSQASFLDDYLELRPERRERVKKLVSQGRILAGPWYTLPAAFLVSGEALVRNLLTGHRIARELGGVMKCAYNIFSWGQVSQLPQIYRQFGMDTILFYRGIDQSNIDRLEFVWDAPDGSRALGITFGEYHRLNFWVFVYKAYLSGNRGALTELQQIARDGGFLFNSHNINDFVVNQPYRRDLDCALEGMNRLLDSVREKSSTSHLGFFQGFDLENPDPEVMDLVDRLNEKLECGRITVSSLPEYVACVRAELQEKGLMESLTRMSGEMLSVERSGDPFAPLYAGVFSARMPLKQQNSRCQRMLELTAEPLASLATLLGAEYPRSVFKKAWKTLLQNHQHDGIGGVHIDRVTLAMEERNREVIDFGETVTGQAMRKLVGRIDFSTLGERELGLTVVNTTGAVRDEVAVVTLDIPMEWGFSVFGSGLKYMNDLSVELTGPDGCPVPHQVLHREDAVKCAYLKFGSHINYEASRLTVAVKTGPVPPFGYCAYRVRPLIRSDRPVETLSPSFGVLENRHLRAEILEDGTVTLLHKMTGAVYPGLNVFEDSGEKGGPLIYDPVRKNQIYRSRGCAVNVALADAGPLWAEYQVDYDWPLPVAVESELKIRVPNGQELCEHGLLQRSAARQMLRIRSRIVLRKDSPVLEFETAVENNIRDHRLRAVFPSGLAGAEFSQADSAFDIARRPVAVPDSTGWYEAALRTWPTQSFASVAHDGRGLAVLHDGLSEYEVTNDATRSIALTLLRCFGTSGAPFETYEADPLAQCQGTQRFRYALYPHAGDVLEANVLKAARDFTVPLRTAFCTAHAGDLPWRHSWIRPDSERFQITCLKQAEESGALILRGFNPERVPLRIRVALGRSDRSVRKMLLEETEAAVLPLDSSGTFCIDAVPGEIVSVAIGPLIS